MIAMLLAICLCTGLCACGENPNVTACNVLISRIGDVTIDSEALILEAEKAYEDLSEDEQKKVGDQETVLEEAREAYDKLLVESYDSAMKLIDENKYEEALAILQKIATYSDSSDWIFTCELYIAAKKHFEGTWYWGNDFGECNLMDNDIYMKAYNPYDSYIIDFETQTVTLKFKSRTTTFDETRQFIVMCPTLLMCQEFRGDKSNVLYLHAAEDGITVTRGGTSSGSLIQAG